MYEIIIVLISFVIIYEICLCFISKWYSTLLLPAFAFPLSLILVFSFFNLGLLYLETFVLSGICRPYCPYLKSIILVHLIGYMLWMVMFFGEQAIQTSIYIGSIVLIFSIWQMLLSWKINHFFSFAIFINIVWYVYFIVLSWSILRIT